MRWLRETRDVFHSYDNLDLVPQGRERKRVRKHRTTLWVGLLGAVAFSTLLWAFALPTIPPVTDLYLDVSYMSHAGKSSPEHRLDVYSRKASWSWGKALRPVVIFVHDASAKGGKKSTYFRSSKYVRKGYVFVPINYRRDANTTKEEQASDVGQAVRWVHRHIHKYRGDRKRISLVGVGSGSMLADMVKKNRNYLRRRN